MLRVAFLAVLAVAWSFPASADRPSRCIAFVERAPDIVHVNLNRAETAAREVEIAYVGHSTFRLTTPAGVVIATDYAGYAGIGQVPHVVTMNHAHETHYTDFPDPAIEYVLRGWNPAGGPAEHHLGVKDVLIRNVSTDIRGYAGTVEPDGNSIFVFEVADLCIGHFGHLHHKPTPEQLARIGRLDVVFAAVDGSYTLDLPSMIEVLQELRASIVIPMHYFGGASLKIFVAGMANDFDVRILDEPRTTVSLATLPRRPTVVVLPGF